MTGSLSQRMAEYARRAHLSAPCRPARPDRCTYCREAAERSGAQRFPARDLTGAILKGA